MWPIFLGKISHFLLVSIIIFSNRFFRWSFPRYLEWNRCCHQSFLGARSDCWKYGGLLQWDHHTKVLFSLLFWFWFLHNTWSYLFLFHISNPPLFIWYFFWQSPSTPKWYFSHAFSSAFKHFMTFMLFWT